MSRAVHSAFGRHGSRHSLAQLKRVLLDGCDWNRVVLRVSESWLVRWYLHVELKAAFQ